MFHYLIKIFFVVTSVLSSIRGECHHSVYVKSKFGSEGPSCGSFIQPCKHLQTAVSKCTKEVVIIGTIEVNLSIIISRNVTVRSIKGHRQPSKIIGERMSGKTAFMLRSGIEVAITGIRFIDVGVVKLSKNTKVSINYCSVTGNVDKVFRLTDEYYSLIINNATFAHIIGNVINEKGNYPKPKHAAISFVDSRFHKISRCGFCSDNLAVSLIIIRCSFIDVAYDNSSLCAQVSIRSSHSLVNDSRSVFAYTHQRKIYAVIYVTKVLSLNITGSRFNNIVSMFNLVFVDTTTNVVLQHNTFYNNKLTFSIVRVFYTTYAVFHHNIFGSNRVGTSVVIVSSTENAHLHNSTFNSNEGESSIVHLVDTTTVSLHTNTFEKNRAGTSVVPVWYTQMVDLRNSTFNSNKAKGVVDVLGFKTGCTISLDNCNFTNNVCDHSVVRIRPDDNSPIPITNLTNTYFHNNSAQEQAHNIYNIGHLTLRNITVISARVSNSLYQINNQKGIFSADNVLFKMQGTSVSTGSNVVRVISQIKRLSNNSFLCPVNSNIDLDLNYESLTKVYNMLSLKCEPCTKGTYSLEYGALKLPELTTKYDKYVKKEKLQCRKCPAGGTCEEGGLKATPSFWGFRQSNHVTFVQCPIGHCCKSKGSLCTSYDTCNKGRKGKLCGRCKKGYRLNFFNESCIKESGKCKNILFASYTTIYSLSITLFFAYVADITDLLKKVWKRLKRRLRCFDALKRVWKRLERSTKCFSNDESPTAEDQETDAALQNRESNKSVKQLPKLVVFHLFVFYYQLANLLHVKVEKQNSKNKLMESITSKITNFAYFRFAIRVHEHICPTTEINFLSKIAIDFIFKLSTLTNLLLFLIGWRLNLSMKNNSKINSWVKRLTPTRFMLQCTDILRQSISWLERNVRIPLIERRTRLQDIAQVDPDEYEVQYLHFVLEENNHYTSQAQLEVPEEDQMRIHIEDQEPISSRHQNQENDRDVRYQEDVQSENLSSQHQLDEHETEHIHQQEQIRYEEYGEEQNRDEGTGESQQDAAALDILSLSESDSDGQISVDDELVEPVFDTSDLEDDEVRPLPFTIRLKLTFIKLLKTIYTPTTEMCFQLVFCISLKNGVKHLYLFGDLVCHTWWQHLIMIVALPGLILFPLTFGISLQLVQTQQITSDKFLVAAGVPYYAIYLYLRKHIAGLPRPVLSVEDDLFANEILRSYEEVFRKHNQLISWPVVQLYRNFIVASVKIFIMDPMYRSLMFLPILWCFFIHDRSAKPFLHKSVNVLQTSSTVCLTMIVICNMIFSFSVYMTNIDTIPDMDTVLTILSYVENIVYFIFPLMLPISILWRKYIVKQKEE